MWESQLPPAHPALHSDRRSRNEPTKCDKRRYRRRSRIEIMFGRLKDWRPVSATRYDRCPTAFFAAASRSVDRGRMPRLILSIVPSYFRAAGRLSTKQKSSSASRCVSFPDRRMSKRSTSSAGAIRSACRTGRPPEPRAAPRGRDEADPLDEREILEALGARRLQDVGERSVGDPDGVAENGLVDVAGDIDVDITAVASARGLRSSGGSTGRSAPRSADHRLPPGAAVRQKRYEASKMCFASPLKRWLSGA
jgi:hypothetical protein